MAFRDFEVEHNDETLTVSAEWDPGWPGSDDEPPSDPGWFIEAIKDADGDELDMADFTEAELAEISKLLD